VILTAIRRWADDDLRSVNGQLEFILRTALKDAGRLPVANDHTPPNRGGDSAAGGETD
jgi:hypothetical protein